jgi:HEAT repeat protein
MNKILFYLLVGCAALAAQAVEVSHQPETVEQVLQEKYQIALTEEGLLGALQHDESDVRGLAAFALAARADKDAINPILDALSTETVQGAKINLATAAALLGSAEGFSALKGMCEDRSRSPGLRMIAAQSMLLNAGREECLPDILDVLGSAGAAPGDHSAAHTALTLLTFKRFKHISTGQLDEVRKLSASYLKSEAPELRMAAGECIRDVGGPWAISQLRAAIDAEQNETVRNSLAQDLASIGQ